MKRYNLRVITNMNCNLNCYFCYQKNKEEVYLAIDNLKKLLGLFEGYIFPRTAIYGGLATIRLDLPDFISLCSQHSDNVSITTNGTLLTLKKLVSYVKAGLDLMGISIPTKRSWHKMRSKPWDLMVLTIKLANSIVPNLRINIVENIYNMDENDLRYLLYDMIEFFTRELGIGVLICRNFTKKYPSMDLSLIGFEKLDIIEHGCSKYKHPYLDNAMVSYYLPVKVYNLNDYIVTPIGTFTNWMRFVVAE